MVSIFDSREERRRVFRIAEREGVPLHPITPTARLASGASKAQVDADRGSGPGGTTGHEAAIRPRARIEMGAGQKRNPHGQEQSSERTGNQENHARLRRYAHLDF
jgi:hypothetical protein